MLFSGDKMEKEILNKLLNLGADDVIVKITDEDIEQVRFSRNRIDIAKNWQEKSADIFVALGKRTMFTTIKDFDNIDASLKTVMELAKKANENQSYYGIA
ncbi:MAG TPA: hypothetical protein ENG41_01440, partial [Methanomicrobia archaeon]|nr:hypothetical protein [Methanomicrobia archaeon]